MTLLTDSAGMELIVAITAGALAGALVVWFIMYTRLLRLRARLEALQALEAERERTFAEARRQMSDTFSALSGDALRRNSEQFMHLAAGRLRELEREAENRLGQRETSVDNLVRPLREALQRTQEQLRTLEQARQEAYGGLSRHLESMAGDQQALRQETANLVKALRRPEVRGRWGETTLRRLAELSGMVAHCDFDEQPSTSDQDGSSRRPDMVVRLPNRRLLIIDAKTPIDAYVDAVEATTDAARDEALKRHARQVRRQVQSLADKRYWDQFEHAPDFVILFIPGEQFLSAALDQDAQLLDDALSRKVILATPTSLVALLRAVAYGWREQTLAENAAEIRRLATQLQHRLGRFTGHLDQLGRRLGASVEVYNRAIGSLERQVMPTLRRFSDLGVESAQPPSSPEPLASQPRQPRTQEDQ